MDILDIAREIFSKPPKEPNSVQLDFSEFAYQETQTQDTEIIFKSLLTMFTEGMKILYGTEEGKVDLTQVSEKDFLKTQEYFQSFGFNICCQILQPNQVLPIDLADKVKLSDHYLRLKTDNMTYIISFDYYLAPIPCK